jgi:putative sterol carrier protein
VNEFFTSASREYQLHTVMPDEVSVTFELEGPDGGVWTLSRLGTQIRVEPQVSEYADCHLRCSVPDFRALIDGQLDGRAAFMDGRVRIRGDVGLILRLLSAVSAPAQ